MNPSLGRSNTWLQSSWNGNPRTRGQDIFALGIVLFEMVTGKKAFEGKSQASLITAIMSSEPPLPSSVEPMSPAGLDYVVTTCLAKDPDDRWQTARDLLRELKRVEGASAPATEVTPSTPVQTPAGWHHAMPLALAALALGAIVSGLAVWALTRATPPVTRTNILLPADLKLASHPSSPLALSPDGTELVYAAAGGRTPTGTSSQLYLRTLDQFDARPIPGTEGAHSPFFSPDGQWVGFFTSAELKKVSLAGGTPLKIADATPNSVTSRTSSSDSPKFSVSRMLKNTWRIFSKKALDIALEKKDPKKKLARRKKREDSSKGKSRSIAIAKNDEPAKSRYIASEVSERVHARAGHQCEHSANDGRRCTSRTGLQIEHVRPFGIFHSHDERFLKLLCAAHNRLAAERVYGAAFIRRKIDKRQRRLEAPRLL